VEDQYVDDHEERASLNRMMAKAHVQKLRESMGFSVPLGRCSDMNDSFEAPTTTDKKALEARARVQWIKKGLTNSQQTENDDPKDCGNGTGDFEPEHEVDSGNPSVETDFLFLSLTYIERPPHTASCRLCTSGFGFQSHPIRNRSAGIKVMGCGHYLHIPCFEAQCASDEKSAEGAEKDEEKELKCHVCISLWAQITALDSDVLELRLERFADMKFPWRRSLRVGDVCP
jgi:hypothetical protein